MGDALRTYCLTKHNMCVKVGPTTEVNRLMTNASSTWSERTAEKEGISITRALLRLERTMNVLCH